MASGASASQCRLRCGSAQISIHIEIDYGYRKNTDASIQSELALRRTLVHPCTLQPAPCCAWALLLAQ
jgi:hypothetical protein